MAETSLWRASGARSPADYLARRSGTTRSQAADAIATARRLEHLPRARAAARAGKLSASQASAIAGAASADANAESRLVEAAASTSLQGLRDDCAATVAAANDSEARRRRIHAGRYVRRYTDAEGAFNLHLRGNPEVGAALMAVIDLRRDELAARAEAEGRRERLEAHTADALVELVREAGGDDRTGSESQRRGGSTKVLVRVDLPALLRGHPTDGETCEIVGYGPVAVSAAREMIESGDPFLAAVVTNGVEVLGVAHLGRRPTAFQRSALEWLHPRCANEACSELADLEIDHGRPWASTHLTLLDWLDRVCGHDHDLKTHHGWSLVSGRGRRAFVPPDDPRHPGNAGDAGDAGDGDRPKPLSCKEKVGLQDVFSRIPVG